MTTTAALAVDLDGLRMLVERRGKSFALMELVQNAWDADNVSTVRITTEYGGYNEVLFTVEDDAPDGFHDLSHAYTLFAPSKKKNDPEKRGRFNLGEKLVIALAKEFTVRTTTGTVTIDVRKNTRVVGRKKREKGSEIEALLRMSKVELEEALAAFRTLIPPDRVITDLNGEPLPNRTPIASFKRQLATEIADGEGYLRPTKRVATVFVYEPRSGETPMLYELGIPVVATGDTYHVNVMQKVPLNADRDNVPPSFLKDIRAHVLNEMAGVLTEEQASTNWVNEALEDELIEPAAVEEVLTKRFGEKRVVFDPSDAEANRIALSKGYSVIPGNTFSKSAWGAIRSSGAALPAGKVTPSPKPFHPDGKSLKTIDPSKYTDAQRRFVRAVEMLHEDLLRAPILVVLTSDITWGFNGAYGGGRVILNVAKMAANILATRTLGVVLHEFAHHYGDHLTHAFDEGIANLSATIIGRIHDNPNYMNEIQEE
jgi:hypothetical protein